MTLFLLYLRGEIMLDRIALLSGGRCWLGASKIIYQMRWVVGDGKLINFMNDSWISNVSLAWYPTFIFMDILDTMSIANLLILDGTQWNPWMVTWTFRDFLG